LITFWITTLNPTDLWCPKKDEDHRQAIEKVNVPEPAAADNNADAQGGQQQVNINDQQVMKKGFSLKKDELALGFSDKPDASDTEISDEE